MNHQFLSATLVMLMVALCSNLNAQEYELLYAAIVAVDGAEVHSGPGSVHYATHRLDQNEIVEVYREDPGGWCLIRPPAKSFSLIPASSVTMLSEDVAELKLDGVEALVGTILGPVEKAMSQISLAKGSRVAVLGEVKWPNPEGKPIVWLQIEPPSGEYRWIRMADLQLPPVKDEAMKVDYSEPPSMTQRQSTIKSKSVPTISSKVEAPEFNSIAKAPPVSGWKASTRPIPESNPEKPQYSATFSSTFNTTDDADSGFIEQATFLSEEPSDPRFESWDGRPVELKPQPDRYASLESMDRQVRSFVRDRSNDVLPPPTTLPRTDSSSVMEIEERLSTEILKDPQNWNLADLKFETERVRALSTDPVERLALQHVMDKIAKCDAICKGYQQAGSLSPRAGSTPNPSASSSTQYDASGWLKRLVSSSGSIDPVYVLQDSLGNVTHEIVGITGMNLSQYADKQVGIMGRRGFNRRRNLKHVTADRVIVIR